MKRLHQSGIKLIIIFVLVTAVIVLFGINFYNHQRDEIRKEKYDDLSAIASLKEMQIVNWRNERLGDAIVLTKDNNIFAAALKRWFKNNRDTVLRNSIKNRLNITLINYQYKNVILVDTSGNVLISISDSIKAISTNTRNYFEESKIKRSAIFSDIYYCDLCSKLHLDVIAPIYDDDKIVAGLIFTIDPYQFLYPLIQSWPTSSKTSESLLLTKIGDEVVFINELRHRKNTALELKIKIDSSNLNIPSVAATFGKSGIMEGIDYRGVPVLSDTRKIPDSPWWMIAKIDLEEVYASTRENAIYISLFVGILVLFFGSGIFWLWNNQQKALYIQHLKEEKERKAIIKHFEYIVKYSNDMFILSDKDLNIREVNDRSLEVYGYTREEMTKLNVRDLRSPETLQQLAEKLDILEETKEAFYEAVHIRKDGTAFPIEMSIRIVEIEGEKYYQSIARNIAERKKAEDERNKLFNVIEKSLNEIYIFDSSTLKFEYVNKGAMQNLGYSFEELKHMTPIDIKPEINYEKFIKMVEPLKTKEKESLVFETIHRRKNGSDYPVEVHLQLEKQAGRNLFLAIINDITERKLAEEAVTTSEKEFRSLAESMPQIVWITKADGWNIYFNQQWVEYTGLTLEESYGHGWNIPFHPDDQGRAWDAWQNAVSNNGVYSIECRLRKHDGTYRWWLIRGVPIKDENDIIIKWFGTCTDIDEVKSIENEIKKLNEELEEKVIERTKELADKNTELSRMNKLFVGRELRMVELKQKIKELEDIHKTK